MKLTEESDFQLVCFVTSLATILSVFGYFQVFKTLRKNQRSSPWFLLLGVSELTFTMHTAMVAVACFNRQWPYGQLGCQIHFFLAFSSLASSVCNAALLWERVKLEKIRDTIPFKSNWTTVIVVWLLTNAGAAALLWAEKPIQVTPNTMACFMSIETRTFYSKQILSILTLSFVILPLISNIYCCYLLRGVTKKVILIPVAYVLTYVPFNLCTQTTVFGMYCFHTVWIKLWPKFGSSLNPYIQMYAHGKMMKSCLDSQSNSGEKKQE